eukprot:CAMPEP_0196807098 /NCGR_PEP_ID=MMETSP1362-20130617/7036_1 /TAXON_ID=163516 /ORGANISM="Leptocylindrus danicus, Strain CCMP1856" /LENGTH=999 /DNA_ID=CAMNT_0042180861 /DNA_START=279 /DNA_END=3278 /DNA_ORIENTATION=-
MEEAFRMLFCSSLDDEDDDDHYNETKYNNSSNEEEEEEILLLARNIDDVRYTRSEASSSAKSSFEQNDHHDSDSLQSTSSTRTDDNNSFSLQHELEQQQQCQHQYQQYQHAHAHPVALLPSGNSQEYDNVEAAVVEIAMGYEEEDEECNDEDACFCYDQEEHEEEDVTDDFIVEDSIVSVHPYNGEEEIDEEEEEDPAAEEEEEEEVNHPKQHRVKVLGPLNAKSGGRTGVVLETDTDNNDDCDYNKPTSTALISSSPPSASASHLPAIMDASHSPGDYCAEATSMLQLSIEAAAKAVSELAVHSPIEASHTMLTSALEMPTVASLSMPSFFGGDDEDAGADLSTRTNKEDERLMRCMCAHLLPPSNDSQNKIIGASVAADDYELMPWVSDEDDGYSTFQHVRKKRLERIERLFQEECLIRRSRTDTGEAPNEKVVASHDDAIMAESIAMGQSATAVMDHSFQLSHLSLHDDDDEEDDNDHHHGNGSTVVSSSRSQHNDGNDDNDDDSHSLFTNNNTTEASVAAFSLQEEEEEEENDDDDPTNVDHDDCDDGISSSSSSSSSDDDGRRGVVSYVRADSGLSSHGNGIGPMMAQSASSSSGGAMESFHLPIIYTAGKTGFEESSELSLYPGMLVAERYLVQQTLGSAAFSTAYRCMDLKHNDYDGDDTDGRNEKSKSPSKKCEVCLKVIRNKKDYFDQSLDEIKILQYLKDSNQCEENNVYVLLDYFYYKEHLIIVTELLCQNLYEFGKFIRENDEPAFFTLKRLNFIARQILVALNFVHGMGIMHTDLKPENILISSYSRSTVKLIDFGSSCYKTDKPSYYIQSRSYRAPEVVLGLPYNEKIDIWSLGCVIAEMFTGYVTFQNDSLASMLSRIESICGNFPRHMTKEGKYSKKFFLESGLLFEKEGGEDGSCSNHHEKNDDDDDDNETYFTIYQPKSTTLAERLGFDPDHTSKDQTLFIHFIKSLLTVDPELRPTAQEALEHPWIVMGRRYGSGELEYP